MDSKSNEITILDKPTVFWIEQNNGSLQALVSLPGISSIQGLSNNVVFGRFGTKPVLRVPNQTRILTIVPK